MLAVLEDDQKDQEKSSKRRKKYADHHRLEPCSFDPVPGVILSKKKH
jgi:hypothetical protein